MISRRVRSDEQLYFFARSDAAGKALISYSPVSKMNEKSQAGGGGGVIAAGGTAGGAAPRPVVVVPRAAGTPNPDARPAWPPTRPPDRLRNPSTLEPKNGLHTIRVDVSPPWEWPASQNALMLLRPICSMSEDTMFWR